MATIVKAKRDLQVHQLDPIVAAMGNLDAVLLHVAEEAEEYDVPRVEAALDAVHALGCGDTGGFAERLRQHMCRGDMVTSMGEEDTPEDHCEEDADDHVSTSFDHVRTPLGNLPGYVQLHLPPGFLHALKVLSHQLRGKADRYKLHNSLLGPISRVGRKGPSPVMTAMFQTVGASVQGQSPSAIASSAIDAADNDELNVHGRRLIRSFTWFHK